MHKVNSRTRGNPTPLHQKDYFKASVDDLLKMSKRAEALYALKEEQQRYALIYIWKVFHMYFRIARYISH